MAKTTISLVSPPVHKSLEVLEIQREEVSITQIATYQTLEKSPSKVVKSHQQMAQVSYSIVHAVPGRLRYDTDYAKRLLALLEADPLVTQTRIKAAAASVVVIYNNSQITDIKMRSRLICLIVAASDLGIVPLNTKQSLAAQEDKEETPWPGLQLSALATGLALLGGPLGVSIPPILTAGTIALATLPVFQRAFAGITTQRKFTIDFLDFIAIAITTVQGQFLTPSLMLSLIEIGVSAIAPLVPPKCKP
jgi:Cu2+-exporting ATPase